MAVTYEKEGNARCLAIEGGLSRVVQPIIMYAKAVRMAECSLIRHMARARLAIVVAIDRI